MATSFVPSGLKASGWGNEPGCKVVSRAFFSAGSGVGQQHLIGGDPQGHQPAVAGERWRVTGVPAPLVVDPKTRVPRPHVREVVEVLSPIRMRARNEPAAVRAKAGEELRVAESILRSQDRFELDGGVNPKLGRPPHTSRRPPAIGRPD